MGLNEVQRGQTRLRRARLYHGAIDGIHGKYTKRALVHEALQQRLPEFWSKLENGKSKDGRELLSACCELLGVSSGAHESYLHATILHETNGQYEPVEEAYWLSEKWRKKNLRYYPYHGRGYIQLTWSTNYEFVEKIFGKKIVRTPAALLDDKNLSMLVAVAGCKFGWFTGHTLDDFLHRDNVDFINARAIVNGFVRGKRVAKKIARVAIADLRSDII